MMSIICRKEAVGWIIDHEEIIKNIYRTVIDNDASSSNTSCRSFEINKKLFEIVTPFLSMEEAKNYLNRVLKRKRKHKKSIFQSQVNSKEVTIIISALSELKHLVEEMSHEEKNVSTEDFEKNNENARKCSALYFNEIYHAMDESRGGNISGKPILVSIKGNKFLIPNNCDFFCTDISKLIVNLPPENKFDFILMDPPWWNKYVRRRKKNNESSGYKMMYNSEVCALPLEQWLFPGALVAVWCTNCSRHVEDVVTTWFPRWGLHHVATWYWLKVTRSWIPVSQFSPPPGKQPFERIIFGSMNGRTLPQPPDNLCLISVPSAIHSHKPPLTEVIKEFLPQEPKCLELFARYLLPHWTSAGDQVLALQNVQLYTQLREFTDS